MPILPGFLVLRAATGAPPRFVWFIWGGMAVLIVIIWYIGAQQRRKRHEQLEQFGMESGFVFSDTPDMALAERLSEISVSLVQMASRPRYRNILQGTLAGGEAIVADRTVGSGKDQTTSTIVAFKFATPFPSFMLCPETVLWRLADKVGYKDIDFEGAPDFSRRFFLHGQDPDAVRALFKPEVIQTFEQLDSKSRLYVSGSRVWLVIHCPGKRVPVQELRAFLQQAEALANGFRRAQSSSVFR